MDNPTNDLSDEWIITENPKHNYGTREFKIWSGVWRSKWPGVHGTIEIMIMESSDKNFLENVDKLLDSYDSYAFISSKGLYPCADIKVNCHISPSDNNSLIIEASHETHNVRYVAKKRFSKKRKQFCYVGKYKSKTYSDSGKLKLYLSD